MARKLTKNSTKIEQLSYMPVPALYVRVSTELQASEGYSLDAQRKRLLAYCEAQGWEVDADNVFVDAGQSGKTVDRPAFQQMMEAVRSRSVNKVVAIQLDRLEHNPPG